MLKHHPTAEIQLSFDPPSEPPKRRGQTAPLILPGYPSQADVAAAITELGIPLPGSDEQRNSVRHRLEGKRSIEVTRLRARHAQAVSRSVRADEKRATRLAARWATMSANRVDIWCEGNSFRLTVLDDEGTDRSLAQSATPQPLGKGSGCRYYWWFRDSVYSTVEDLTAEDVAALQLATESRKLRKLQRARAQVAPSEVVREHLPDGVKIFVWRRDGGACVRCSSQARLEFDHVIPVSLGGATTARNLQVLCQECNRSKGANVV